MPPKKKLDVAFTSESKDAAEDVLRTNGVRVDKIVTRSTLGSEKGVNLAAYGDVYLLQPLTPDVMDHVRTAALGMRVPLYDRATNIWV